MGVVWEGVRGPARSDNEEWCDFAGLKYSDSIIQKYFLNNLLLHELSQSSQLQ